MIAKDSLYLPLQIFSPIVRAVVSLRLRHFHKNQSSPEIGLGFKKGTFEEFSFRLLVLFETAQLQPGQRVLIHAGSGGVGHYAVQLANWKGAYVFATASSKNQDFLRELGVDEPIDYTQQRFELVAQDTDIVLDTLGDETQERSWSVLKPGGVLVSLVQLPSQDKAKELGVRAVQLAAQPNAAQLAEIAGIIDAGQLAPVIDRILPLSEVRRAHELSQSGHTVGKIVLRVSNGNGTFERKTATL
ncbi:MAG: NADP-dependent oxidoreductase [Verrucomicrobia bacterium]|nr:NADP-dependent oxidoreductase [Verrucomicrobiota bacterium]